MAETGTEQVAEGRKGDGYVIVVQDNAARQLTIHSMNEVAAELLGYPAEELQGRKLEVILGQRSALAIDDDLEYVDDAPDMGDVLSRQRELRLRTRLGAEITIATTVNRVMAEDKNPRFQLIIPNEREGRARQQLRQFFQTSLEGHTQLDATTGLPNRATAEAYLRQIGNMPETSAAFAVLRLDRAEKSIARYGAAAIPHLLQHVANICKTTFRDEDVICALGGPMLGLLLVDVSRESARVVLNRLRWNIRNHTIEFGGKSDFSSTVSIAFDMLANDNSERLLADNETAVAGVGADERNILIERGN